MGKPLQTWPIVALAFAALLLLGLVVTVLTLDSVARMRASVLKLSDAHQSSRSRIEALRSQIYVSSIIVRDYLLEKDPEQDAGHRARLRENHAAAIRHLGALQRLSSAGTDMTLSSLSTELDAYWQSISFLIEKADTEEGFDSYGYIQSQILPRRQAVIALAEELLDVSNAESRAGREQVNRSIGEFQDNIMIGRAVLILIVLALALFTILRVYRVERASAAERLRVEAAEIELRNLSQELVKSQEQERRFLSRELHDQVGQMLTALRFGLSDLEAHCGASATTAFSRALQNCRAMLEQTVEAIRGLAMGLRPTMLDDLGLGAAIEWQAREFSRRFNIPASVNVDRALADWPEPQRTALYRITQEALTNCAKHAHASSVRIDLARNSDSVRLVVADDGIGIAAGQPVRGFGLIGMTERVRELRGTLAVRPAPGRGTVVEVTIPHDGEGISA